MKMPLEDKRYSNYKLYESEIDDALQWFFAIRDADRKGWAWVQFIEPNEQNTAEVVCAVLQNENWLVKHPDKIPLLIESIHYWLVDVSHAKLSIDFVWVMLALQKVRESELLKELVDTVAVAGAIEECTKWLCENRHMNEKSECAGWSDNIDELPGVIRTSLAMMALSDEIEYLEKTDGPLEKVKMLQKIVDETIDWLISIRRPDYGWGNLDARAVDAGYQNGHEFSYRDLKYQCDSNPAATGYALYALSRFKKDARISRVLRETCGYLIKTQGENGSWNIFTETGIREGIRYTFRHFSTAWALQGMLESGEVDYTDECVILGLKYLIELQDKNYGGFKSSPDADNYTWATCNAIATINMLKEKLTEVNAEQFLGILWDWWDIKKKDTSYSFSL